jgi:hypothetical protein
MPKESRSVPAVEQGQTRRCDVTKKEFPCEKNAIRDNKDDEGLVSPVEHASEEFTIWLV